MADHFSPDLADIDPTIFNLPDDGITPEERFKERVRLMRANVDQIIKEGKRHLSPTTHCVVVDLGHASVGKGDHPTTYSRVRETIGAELFDELVTRGGYRMEVCSGCPTEIYAYWTDMQRNSLGYRGIRINFKKHK